MTASIEREPFEGKDVGNDSLADMTRPSAKLKIRNAPPDVYQPTAPEKDPQPWDDLNVPDEGVQYYSIKKNFSLRLRSPISQFVNGRTFSTPGKRAVFTNGSLVTHDKETIYELNRLLEGPGRWSRLFWRRPSTKIMNQWVKAKQDAQKREKELLEKSVGQDGIEEMQTFDKFLARQKEILGRNRVQSDMASLRGGR